MSLPTILDDILRHKRGELAAAQRVVSLPRLKELAAAQTPARPFAAALRATSTDRAPRLIAEIKKASPARGSLAPDLDVRATARAYAAAGASAISVLTDRRFFGGHLDDLRAARGEVAIPVLRKDFLFSPYQLFEARAAGADAALLIVAALASPLADLGDLSAGVDAGAPDLEAAGERLSTLLAAARSAGFDCLVEVHDEAELDVAARAGAEVIGINNRNLRTFETQLEVTERLAARVPAGVVLVSESGINTAEDVRRLRRAGASAILVGSAIVSAPDPAAKIKELIG
ncbi:MAG: indole-3-glycerol phosphate synthase TrpC [Chloroflexota bacterium]